ncbi:MAG: hypothetical protein LBR47_06240 [Spirochaetaceae bacterium]|jgi:diaminopimelate epimerase|nr:hypothetical protein [Spirochaetaceae bacterium]
MEIPFYKMHIGGNGFLLIDLTRVPRLAGLEAVSLYPEVSRIMCGHRYGVGAAGCIFLAPDNGIRFFSHQGKETDYSGDALLCAARYAFDSGRITRNQAGTENLILFRTLKGEISLRIIGAHEFSLCLGSPFSALTGAVITPESMGMTEVIDVGDRAVRAAAVHIHEDVIAVFPGSAEGTELKELAKALRGHFKGRPVHIVMVRTITRETLVIRTADAGMSASCAAAAAAVILCAVSGLSDKNAVAVFSHRAPEAAVVPEADPDNSRRLAVLWDTEKNELTVIGTGGYLFEGTFVIPDGQGEAE